MNQQSDSRNTQSRRYGWLGTALLLGLLTLAACSQSQPAATSSADANPVIVATEAQPAAASAAQPAAEASAVIVKLNLNTASNDQFLTLPGVGSRMVREFNEYRPYTSILQFRKEIGKYVDAAQVAAYEEYLFVPIDPNSADAATLQQIPGVDETLAATLIGARPFASNATFAQKLAETLTPEQVAVAESYLVGQ